MSIASLLLIAVVAVALCEGRFPVSLMQLWHDRTIRIVVIDARLPRILAAALVGAALATSGTAYQALFRNPLVSPGMLGVLSGSAFGAALGIIGNLLGFGMPICAFIGGVVAVAVGLGIARSLGRGTVLTLLLGGLVSNAIFTAAVSLVKYVADPMNQLPTLVYWLLGSLAQSNWPVLQHFGIPLAAGTVLLCCFGPALDVLSLDDDEARSLGLPVGPLRIGIIALATFLSALTVSVAGVVGWVGLLVPHLARLLAGASNSRVLPLSAVLGAILLIVADTCARTLSPGEIPLGIVTDLAGALAFILVLRRLRGGIS